MSRAIALVLVAGCGFKPAASTDANTNGSDADLGGMEKPPGSEPLPVAPCYTTVTDGLVLCLELDDQNLATAKDGSGLHHDATIAATNVAMRDVPMPSQAAQIISTSIIDIAESPDFDFQTLTLAAWVHPEGMQVSGQQYGVIHNRGQYYMSIDDQGEVYCAVENGGTAYVRPGDVLPLNTWSFAACTYDGTNICAFAFPSTTGAAGNAVCGNASVAVNTNFTSGISIGSLASATGAHSNHLAGKLDSVRIYSRPLTKAEICTTGGISGC
jgi:hypothetical protein